jgi:hypothetical protein
LVDASITFSIPTGTNHWEAPIGNSLTEIEAYAQDVANFSTAMSSDFQAISTTFPALLANFQALLASANGYANGWVDSVKQAGKCLTDITTSFCCGAAWRAVNHRREIGTTSRAHN